MTKWTRFGFPVRPPGGPENPTPKGHAQPTGLVFGFTADQAPSGLPLGASPLMRNMTFREGGVEPRSGWNTLVGSASTDSSAHLLNRDYVTGLHEYQATAGARSVVVLSKGTFLYYDGSWHTTGFSSAQAPTGGDDTYWDTTTIYHPTVDENVVVATNGIDEPYCWTGPSGATVSTLTNAPIGKVVASFDNRVVFGNITASTGSAFPQRVQWSERGNPEVYSEPTGGFEELLDANGRIQRIVEDYDRILILFELETWVGMRADYPFDLQFAALDRSVGCAAPWSVAKTPKGTVWLGHDYNLYLCPRGGAPQPVGQTVWPTIRSEIYNPERSTGAYDFQTGEYILAYPIADSSGRPERQVRVNLTTGTWSYDVLGFPTTRIAQGTLSSGGTTFAQLVGTFAAQTLTYGQLSARGGERVLLCASSAGTVAQQRSTYTQDLGTNVDARVLTPVPNSDPTRQINITEVWLDYKADSASTVTLKFSADWGTTYSTASYPVALSAASLSAQTTVPVNFTAHYPCLEIEHGLGQRWRIHRAQVVAELIGR